MSDLRTIRIPVSMKEPVTYLEDTVEVGSPIHVVGTSENPDDFCLAFYSDPATTLGGENHRASLIAVAASRRDEETPLLVGDILLAVEPSLADKIVENDKERQRDFLAIDAFKEWLLSYAEVSGEEVSDIFAAVSSYSAYIAHEAHESVRRDHAQQIAHMMGLSPDQVGVFFV